jgi:Tfp pilus assembly protein PilF
MVMEIGDSAIAKRRLMLHDAVTILTVVLITAVLFAITLFLFRSFSAHRAELAQRWSERGRRALQANKPAEAIVDLRTALSYAPGTRAYELMLAQALGQAGRTEESYNYYLGLWETAPGDGNINLALARLAAHKSERTEAVNHYRAAIYGTWEQGDGVQRRAGVRAELARYLIDQHDLHSARMELLIAGGNTPGDYDRDLSFGRLFEAAQDPKDAEVYYRKAIAARPNDATALEAAGRLAYTMADYEAAHRLLDHATDERAKQHAPEVATDAELARDAARLLELNPAPSLPLRERVGRIVAVRSIAKKRFETCEAHVGTQPGMPVIESLAARWTGPDATSNAGTLLRDPARQDAALQLAFDTERQTQTVCGTPSRDDALLLRLATSSSSKAIGGNE